MPNKIKKTLLNIIEEEAPNEYETLRTYYIMYETSQSNVTEREINEFVANYLREVLFNDDEFMYCDEEGCELNWDERVDLALKAFQEEHEGVIIEKIDVPKMEILCN